MIGKEAASGVEQGHVGGEGGKTREKCLVSNNMLEMKKKTRRKGR